MIPIGETLKIPGAALTANDTKDTHQHQQSLGVYAPLGSTASPAVPAGRQSDRDWQNAGLKGPEQYRRTGTRMAASVVLCSTFSRPWMEGLVIRSGRCPHRGNSAASANAPGIASDGVAARNGVDTVSDAPSQLTAETESSSGAEDWQGAGGCRSLHYKSEGLIWN